MTHLVTLNQPIAGKHVIRTYPGFGIKGADISATGESGPSPVLNDNPGPTLEYAWRLKTPPGTGTVTLFKDLTFLHEGATVSGSWQYDLLEMGQLAGTGTVNYTVATGDAFLTPVDSDVVVSSSQGAISQTHTLAPVSVQVVVNNTASAISQAHQLAAASSQTVVNSSNGSVSQTPGLHLLTPVNSTLELSSSRGQLQSTHLLVPASNAIAVQSTRGSLRSTHALAPVSSTFAISSSTGAITQVHSLQPVSSAIAVSSTRGRLGSGNAPLAFIRQGGAYTQCVAAKVKYGGIYVDALVFVKHAGTYRPL